MRASEPIFLLQILQPYPVVVAGWVPVPGIVETSQGRARRSCRPPIMVFRTRAAALERSLESFMLRGWRLDWGSVMCSVSKRGAGRLVCRARLAG